MVEVNVRVTTGRLDQRVARLDAPGFLRLFDHAQGNAILDASSRIEVFQLRINGRFDSQTLRKAVETHQRGVSDVLRDGIQGHRRDARGGDGGHSDVVLSIRLAVEVEETHTRNQRNEGEKKNRGFFGVRRKEEEPSP